MIALSALWWWSEVWLGWERWLKHVQYKSYKGHNKLYIDKSLTEVLEMCTNQRHCLYLKCTNVSWDIMNSNWKSFNTCSRLAGKFIVPKSLQVYILNFNPSVWWQCILSWMLLIGAYGITCVWSYSAKYIQLILWYSLLVTVYQKLHFLYTIFLFW